MWIEDQEGKLHNATYFRALQLTKHGGEWVIRAHLSHTRQVETSSVSERSSIPCFTLGHYKTEGEARVIFASLKSRLSKGENVIELSPHTDVLLNE